MKYKFSGSVCLLLVFCLMCSATAYAADASEKQTTITYTKIQEPKQDKAANVDSEGENESVSTPLYEISIPSEMSLNSGSTLPIYLIENNLSERQTLEVYIDGAKSYADDGLLHLKGEKTQEEISVLISRYDTDGSYTMVTQLPCPTVAVFRSGNIRPVKYGTISFNVVDEETVTPDTYTGNLYFTFSILNS